jgi:hypothetical protein
MTHGQEETLGSYGREIIPQFAQAPLSGIGRTGMPTRD